MKNTLAGIAAKEAGIDAFENQLAGPSAIAFINGEMIDAAKALRDFAKENPQLVIKSGFYKGEALDEAGINKFANLESREVLLSKVAGGAKGAIAKIARTVDALRIKLEESEGAPAEAPAEEAASEEAAE